MKKALISVYDKTGIVEFATGLVDLGYEIISTGGTFTILEEAKLPVTYISKITDFPEILDGRVKTLHPRIHGGILAKDTAEHQQELASIGGELIHLVAVNLYPFEMVSQQPGVSEEQVLENIDIGGPTLLRAAAKNHPRVTVVCEPNDYQRVLAQLQAEGLSLADRKALAAKAFAHTAYYDTLITQYLTKDTSHFPQQLTIALNKVDDLRYGENPHQQAAFYQQTNATSGLATAKQLNGKELSFNNIYDTEAAWQLVSNFTEPCVVAVKHNNPCGLAVGSDLYEAWTKAYAGDPVSIFGGIIACNRAVDVKTAEAMSKIFLEVIVAPEFTPEALELLSKKANLRLLQLAPELNQGYDWKKVTGGLLIQEGDQLDLIEEQLKVVTKRQPTDGEWLDLRFAWKVVKYVKSNAIVFCKGQQLIGVGAGQMNRVQSVRLAANQAGEQSQGGVLGSDAFFPFPDNIEEAARAGITAIIQPGGSVKDQEVIAACDQYNIAMVFTGIRHFRH